MLGIDENPWGGELLFAFKNTFLQKRHYKFIDFCVLFLWWRCDEDVLVSTVITFTSYTTLSQLLTFLETTSDLVTQTLTWEKNTERFIYADADKSAEQL